VASAQSVYLWGAQIEQSGSAGTYVATTNTQESGGTPIAYTYDYDRYGNRWHQDVNGSSGTNYTYETSSITNHIVGATGLTYDTIGNIIGTSDSNGTHSYTYDAEGKLISVDGGATATYQYDAERHRAGATVGGVSWEYVFDASNHVSVMYKDSPRTVWRDELYAGDWHLATYVNGTTEFVHADWLGSVRLRTGPTGNIVNSYTNLPFGDCLGQNEGSPCNGLVGALAAHFTDQDRDTESGLDHFLFRQYSSVQGRWMMPDPAGASAVDPNNPQTWNQYAYVANGPLSATDPTGLRMCLECVGGGGGYGGYFGDGGGPYDGDGYCSPEYEYCGDPGIGVGIGGGGDGGSGGGSAGSTPPPTGGNLANFPKGETLGIPNGISLRPGNIWGLFLPIDSACEFGPCISIAGGFGPADDVGFSSVGLQLSSDLSIGALKTAIAFLRNVAHGPGNFPTERLFGTHWCGPGGGDTPVNGLDAACMAHDACYKSGGFSFSDVFRVLPPDQASAIQACNQQLCDAARKSNTGDGRLVDNFFSTQVRYKCH
jgi:RHS repeat-associated protein